MKNKLALFIAVILGLVAVVGIRNYIGGKEETFKQQYVTLPVATAAVRIKAGTEIQANMLSGKPRSIPESAVTDDHIAHSQSSSLVGQTINRNVERGASLLASYFRKPMARLENKLDHGERAITLRVDSITGIAGNVVPGSRVDILGTFPVAAGSAPAVSSGSNEGQTMLLLPNVTVLAVDNRTREAQYVGALSGARSAQYNSVTVAVTPKEANILVYAQGYGMLSLTLRAPADIGVDPSPAAITSRNLLQEAAQAAAARADRLKERPPLSVEE